MSQTLYSNRGAVPAPGPSAFSTKSNTTIYMGWLGTQPTAGTHTITIVNAQGTTIGTTGNINWNANANTWATNIVTALNAVTTGWTVQSVGISGRVVFSIQAPVGTFIQLGTTNVASLTNGSDVRFLVPLSSVPAIATRLVAAGGGATGDIYIYGSTVTDATLVLERQTSITNGTIVSIPDVVGVNGLMVGRLGSADGPNLSGQYEAI